MTAPQPVFTTESRTGEPGPVLEDRYDRVEIEHLWCPVCRAWTIHDIALNRGARVYKKCHDCWRKVYL